MSRLTLTVLVSCLLLAGAVVVSRAEDDRASLRGRHKLADCVRLGLKRSPRALNAVRDEQIAEARIMQTRSLALPHISLTADYRRLDELQEIEFGEEVLELGTLDNYSILSQVSQVLYSGGKVRAALRAAGLTRTYATEMRADAETALIRDIKIGFHDVLLAQEAVKVYAESVKQLEALLKQTEDRFKHQTASEFDVLRATVKVANERPMLIRARNRRAVTLETFKKLLSVVGVEPFELNGALAYEPIVVTREQCQALAIANRPLLRAAGSGVALKAEDLSAAKAEHRPNVSVFGTYNGANSYTFVSYEDEWEWHWNAGLAMTWSLWDGGLTRGIVREKSLQLEKGRTNLADLRDSVRLEVTQVVLNLEYAREAVEASKGNVALAEKALKIAQARQKTGLGTYLEYTDANVALSRARLSHVSALRDHQNSLARLEYAVGVDRAELTKGNKP